MLLGIAISALFVAPALLRPTLGRLVLILVFLAGAGVSLLYTLPNAPDSLTSLVATAPIPPYREVITLAVAWNLAPTLALAAITFELTAAVLIVWRGPLCRIGLLAAGVWGIGMLPVVPPFGLPIGIALTAAPGLTGLMLARGTYSDSVFSLAMRRLTRPEHTLVGA